MWVSCAGIPRVAALHRPAAVAGCAERMPVRPPWGRTDICVALRPRGRSAHPRVQNSSAPLGPSSLSPFRCKIAGATPSRSMPWWYRRPHTTSVQASREAVGPAGVALLYNRGFAMLTRGGSNFSFLSFGLIRPDLRSFLAYLPEKWCGNAGCFVNTTPCKRFLTFRGGKIGSHILPLHHKSWLLPKLTVSLSKN